MRKRILAILATSGIIASGAVLASDPGKIPDKEGVTTNEWTPETSRREHSDSGNACRVDFQLGPGAEVHLTGPVCPSASPVNVPGWWDRLRARFNPQT